MAENTGAGPSTGPAPPQAVSTSLVRKRTTDLELMPPPPPTKRIKRPKTVIDEDSYTEALSHIIARDFFPGLLESETQQEYLDALESKDEAWIASAGRRLQHVMTPGRKRNHGRRGTSLGLTPISGQTPRTFVGDTPVSVVSAVSAASTTMTSADKVDVDTAMSLGAFQAKYTSEDNESFYKLLDRQNSKKVEKYAWLWMGNKLPSRMQLKQREVEVRLLEARGSLVDDGFKRDRLAIKDGDDRPAQCDTWKTAPDNALMFAPAGVEDTVATTTFQKAEAESRAPPRAINYQNTRLPQPDISSTEGESVPSSPSLSAVRDAIAGKRTEPRGNTSTAVGSETPRVNGYSFVDDEEPVHEQKPLPKIDLGPGDDTPNPFMIKAQPRREALHHRMVDRISQSKRSASTAGMTGKVDKTPVPKFPSSPRVGSNFTPAAQRLWGKIGSKSGMTPRTPFGDTTPRHKGSKLKQVAK
ncbi:nuclear protein DGCR14 [Microdochium trichocladiopsis]|uniref:Nuclear protein DGCR14 n=1 Tax=Microdochium trichocladiopsis TaxID=1682393 RepID=A0A9P8YAP8_9PEZI|nr:nuclear protein DGCR14 [Microdochium trichocladiopsis]KAH7032894.1 nuclear protein DGCR14 [Microdochium trichocladiopsis]